MADSEPALICRVLSRFCALPLDCVFETMRRLPVERLARVRRPIAGVGGTLLACDSRPGCDRPVGGHGHLSNAFKFTRGCERAVVEVNCTRDDREHVFMGSHLPLLAAGMTMRPKSAADRVSAAGGPGTPGNGRLVLVVDDDPLNRELMELRLRDAGFAVETSDSGEAAVPKALESQPDAVLSDIQMPGMDGFELRRTFRRDARLARIPVVLVSSALADEKARRGKDFDGQCVARSPDLHEAIAALVAAPGGSSDGTRGRPT